MAAIGYVLVSVVVLVVSRVAIQRIGFEPFLIFLASIVFISIYAAVSFRSLLVPFIVWILSIGGFRFLLTVRAPILPDLYLDRLAMIWLVVVFSLKFVAQKRSVQGPFSLDVVVLLHGVYILAQIIQRDMEFFGTWVASILIPYTAYFMAKNVVKDTKALRTLMWVLLALSVYYNVTSVAEKFNLNWLIWPKYIVELAKSEFVGRSQGPFMQAPLFGTVIGMILPVHLYWLSQVRQNWIKALLLISLLLGFAGLYFTYTRGSWLAGVAAVVTTVVLNRKVYFKYLAPSLILVPLVAVSILSVAQDQFLKERVEDEDTIGSRLGTAVTVFRVWRDHPLFGVGFFQYKNVRENYIQPVEIPGMPVIRFVQFRHNSIHDIYLGPLAETGIVGTFLQFGIYFLILRAFWTKYRGRDPNDHMVNQLFPILGGVLAGYLFGGIAFDYRFFSITGTLFMVCAGIVDGYAPAAPALSPVAGKPGLSSAHAGVAVAPSMGERS